MPYMWIAPNGDKMISDCLFCEGTHLFDINKCPAPAEAKRVTNCQFCGGDHAWNIEHCPRKDDVTVIIHCLFCGGDHEKDKDKCPAIDTVCERCGKAGHFPSECARVAAAEERAADADKESV